MADRARGGFAGALRYELLTFFDAANWGVGNEARVRVAEHFGCFRVDGHFNNSVADGLCGVALERNIHADGQAGFGNGASFDNLDPRSPGNGSEVGGGLLDLFVGHVLRERRHEVGVALARVGAMAKAVAEIMHLMDEVVDGKTGDAGVLGTAFAVGIVAERAGPDLRLAAVSDDFGHLRMVVGEPIGGAEAILNVCFGEGEVRAGKMLEGVVRRRRRMMDGGEDRIRAIGPEGRGIRRRGR